MALLTALAPLEVAFSRRALGWCAAWCALLAVAFAEPAALTEYQIKAVFLFNFTRFIEWPPAAFATATSPIVIGVLGEDPFGQALDEAARGEKINGRTLIVQRYRTLADVPACHILFVSRSETARLDEIIAALKTRSVLSVSDAVGFTAQGGMIRFVTEKNRVRLRINLAAAKAAQLTLSSKLLRPAEIVGPGQR